MSMNNQSKISLFTVLQSLYCLLCFSLIIVPASGSAKVIINEIDADQTSFDTGEFIELYDGGDGNTSLNGLVLVLYNGGTDTSYRAFDLDGFSTDNNGYFVLCGDAANVPNCDAVVAPSVDLIQNGADAAALYQADAADFPTGTAVTTTNLVDAVVYDTDDSDDPGLLVLLNAGQPQVNELAQGSVNHSNQRCPNGRGRALNTDLYTQGSPSPGTFNVCGCYDPTITISSVQGSGSASPLAGSTSVVQGVVVGDFQTSEFLSGFFVQEEDTQTDGDPATSEGIFIRDGANPAVDVAVGEVVRVQGLVREHFNLTILDNAVVKGICPSSGTASPATINFPLPSVDILEQYEGMLIHIPQKLYVTDNYWLGGNGEVELAVGGRLWQPTHITAPGASALALQELNHRSHIQLDDGRWPQRPDPVPYIGPGGTLRIGDTIPELVGVLGFASARYEVHPTGPVNFTHVNARQIAPQDVGGTIKIASLNTQNYFSTLDDSGHICGPQSNAECRGANSDFELNRQRNKLVNTILAMDADLVGLLEIENHPSDAALKDLVDNINLAAGDGTYDWINSGPIGLSAIKLAFIYKPGTLSPAGLPAVLDSAADPLFLDDLHRPSLAQTFIEDSTGEKFTAVINHFKSKGSACDGIGDPDAGDGQGNCNGTRVNAANALTNWLASDPTFGNDPDYIILGDLNAYAMEDPIAIIKNANYTDLIEEHLKAEEVYTYQYFGQTGGLDYAFANSTLAEFVTGAAIWHINADEPQALDYRDKNQASLYTPDPYRSSDHDPVIVGLDLVPGCSGDECDDPAPKDTDGDGVADDKDQCEKDPNKSAPGVCGCGTADEDLNDNTVMDCLYTADLFANIRKQIELIKSLKKTGGPNKKRNKKIIKAQAETKTTIKALATAIVEQIIAHEVNFIKTREKINLKRLARQARRKARKALRTNKPKLRKLKKAAVRALKKLKLSIVE
jgi:uncharacterized protein